MIALYCVSSAVRISRRSGVYYHMHHSGILLALGVLTATGWAQSSAGVAGPVTGFVLAGTSGTLRPMLGIPGAAHLGGPVASGLTAASVSPDGSTALTVQAHGQLVAYTGLRAASPAPLKVASAIAGADLFAWSPDGSGAAVYASTSRQGQMLTSLAKSPATGAPIDLSSLPGPVAALAFDGKNLILGVSGELGGIYLTNGSAAPLRIAAGGNPSGITLAGASLYFADNQSNQIWQVQNYATTPAALLFASDNNTAATAGLQVSADGLRLFVASDATQKLAVYDIASRSAVQSVDLAIAPTRLDRFGDASVFLLNAGSTGPLYVVRDGGAGKAAVYFVPAPPQNQPLKSPIRRM